MHALLPAICFPYPLAHAAQDTSAEDIDDDDGDDNGDDDATGSNPTEHTQASNDAAPVIKVVMLTGHKVQRGASRLLLNEPAAHNSHEMDPVVVDRLAKVPGRQFYSEKKGRLISSKKNKQKKKTDKRYQT